MKMLCQRRAARQRKQEREEEKLAVLEAAELAGVAESSSHNLVRCATG